MSTAPAPLDTQTSTALHTPFGRFDVRPEDVIGFPSGLPGFETARRFVLLTSPDLAPLQCLHALDGTASFLVVNPRVAEPGYRQALARADRLRLAATPRATLLWVAIVTVEGPDAIYVNLRAPVVINPSQMIGCQLMPSQSPYDLRHRLVLTGD